MHFTSFALICRKERNSERRKSRTKIDLTLPGWGAWGGRGLRVSGRRRKRFTVVKETTENHPLAKKQHLILADDTRGIKEHRVSQVPFPFKSVSDFESSIRAPLGDTFVPQTVFKKNIKPKVVTKLGVPIAPIDKEELLKRSGEC